MNYLPADDSFIINCGSPSLNDYDQDLTPIRISLPKPPRKELIEGFGLAPEDQFWKRPKMPQRLIDLEEQVTRELKETETINKKVNGQMIIDKIWDEINKEQGEWLEEINFIKRQWYHRIFGYWFYNNGKPTYICGWHYMYLTWWYNGKYKNKYAEYRERDRKNYLFWWYLFNTRETFAKLDPKTDIAIPEEDGTYKMIELSFRTSYGCVQPKNRRGGTTNMVECIIYCETSQRLNKHGAILSLDSESAYKLFNGILVKTWEKMPFFFKPTWGGFYNQESAIKFNRAKSIVIGNDLNSRIDYAQSARGSEYDGDTIDYALIDESGKTKEADVTERWSMIKQTLSIGEGADIRGFSVHPSTVEDMDLMGGAKYQALIEASNFYQRDKISGQTKSGLSVLLFPAYENLEEFTDKYGFPIMDHPTTQQIKDGFKRGHGSRSYLQSRRDTLLKSGTPNDMKEYKRLVAKFPFKLEECFKMSAGDIGFDTEKIDKRLAQLRRMPKDPCVIGNFLEINGKVQFIEDKINGRFKVSHVLNPGEVDLKVKVWDFDQITGIEKEKWQPKYPKRFTAGGDPFKYNGSKALMESTGSYMSDGGFAVFWELDKNLDKSDNMEEWESYRFVCTYRARPSTSDEFCKDCLLACRYYGSPMFPETNVEILWQYFEDKGYGGYLLHEYDESTNKLKPKPGVYNVVDSKNDIFDLTRNYISYRSHKEMHVDLLMEWKGLKSFDDLTKKDLASAAGCCFLGSRSRHREILESVDSYETNLDWWLDYK